ncbi:PaaI family thioesterase [Zavarzinia sp. CC-PAN008]|uniref:PaaI family thioesterase n=1 Tax=Zavarzinia sp. CC-PAN008 TaxID=3243332 RepID=UPI003F74A17A
MADDKTTADTTVAGAATAAEPGYTRMIGPYGKVADRTGAMRYGFIVEGRHLNANDIVHGGMLMSFADHLLSRSAYDGAGRRMCSTVSLNCDFVAPGKPGDCIFGDARVTRATKTLVFVTGEIRNEERILMSAHGVWKVVGA